MFDFYKVRKIQKMLDDKTLGDQYNDFEAFSNYVNKCGGTKWLKTKELDFRHVDEKIVAYAVKSNDFDYIKTLFIHSRSAQFLQNAGYLISKELNNLPDNQFNEMFVNLCNIEDFTADSYISKLPEFIKNHTFEVDKLQPKHQTLAMMYLMDKNPDALVGKGFETVELQELSYIVFGRRDYDPVPHFQPETIRKCIKECGCKPEYLKNLLSHNKVFKFLQEDYPDVAASIVDDGKFFDIASEKTLMKIKLDPDIKI